MIRRLLEKLIHHSLQSYPATVILGPRQVGKTTLAKQLLQSSPSAIYIDLERPSDLAKLSDAELYLSQNNNDLVIIDEVQRRLDLFPLLRSLIDERRENGRFLLLGSSSPFIIKESSESLAGRVSYHELHPFSIAEIEQFSINQLWLRGGFPEAYLAVEQSLAFDWLTNFVQTYIERELAFATIRISPIQMRHFVTLLASVHGQLLNYSDIARASGISHPTLKEYINFLERSYLIRIIRPYYVNIKKRLVKSPKLYFRDSGIYHQLLGITTWDDLQGNVVKGASWEGFVIQQIISLLNKQSHYYFYRSLAGAEVDLVILKGNIPYAAFEIKYSNSPSSSKGLTEALRDLNCTYQFIVTPSADEFYLQKKLLVIPIHRLRHHMEVIGISVAI